MSKKFVNINNARAGEYKEIIEKIASTGKCPFCKENFIYHKKPIYKKHQGWFVTEVSWPYENTRCHLMILGEKHIENISQLKKTDLESISFLANWALKKFKIKGGALASRFGDTDYTGASVSHLHFHLIAPERDEKSRKTKLVNFPIG